MAVLNRPTEERNKKLIKKLETFFANMLFFKNLLKDTDKETLFHCYKVMQLQSFKEHDTIF